MSEAMTEERGEALRLIRDSAAAIAPPGGTLGRIRALRFTSPGFDPAVWREMAAMGWTGLLVPEKDGGTGLGLAEYAALLEALGAGLVPEPLIHATLSCRLLAGILEGGCTLRGCGMAGEVLAATIEGSALPLTAWQEKANSLDVPGTPGGARLFLPGASGATHFLVPLRHAGGLALHLLPAEGADLALEPTQDGGEYGTLRPSEGTRLADDVSALIEQALEEASLGTAAYLLGVMDRALAMTLDYLRTRQQFGRIIGTFQSLHHKAADLRMQTALARASLDAAIRTAEAAPGSPARRAAIARAKHRASEAAMIVTRQAIQLHGGIGYTDEHDIGLYLRKAMVLANQFGGAGVQRARFMASAPALSEE